MKFSLAVLALIASVQAQTRSDIPECALPCLDDAIESETDCKTTDYVCVCKNFDDVRSKATTCVIDKCGSDVAINEVLPATEALCENPGGSSESGAESSKAETTAAEATTAAEETSAAPETTSEAAATTSAAAETTSEAEEETTTTVPPVVSTTGAAETTGEAPVSTPAPTTVEVNGAAGLKGVGAIAMVALAAIAL
ncbi:hypothetical protein BHE90_015830 [Fusarium euwallaceae]|uniref:CFEM domain-containing protein n=3 Tax=Fusarium solani species complex TaxID=232080 RepID=A0A430L221_9HYPO|nr:hypothetical protein CEP51_012696 [Fusarium floridanum]RSM09810.1 hypothetical protein CDV31_007550 [Fusarium ambrosium]RTE69784.1 hypothetical protein BHE90_015830 [Fusarium euwallaceae]